jgi:hypothetical protein
MVVVTCSKKRSAATASPEGSASIFHEELDADGSSDEISSKRMKLDVQGKCL